MRQIFIADTDQEAMRIAEPAYNTWYRSITELWHKNNDTSFDDFFSWESCLNNETILVGSVDSVKSKILDLVEKQGSIILQDHLLGDHSPSRKVRSPYVVS